jgi:hypothetical protein
LEPIRSESFSANNPGLGFSPHRPPDEQVVTDDSGGNTVIGAFNIRKSILRL